MSGPIGAFALRYAILVGFLTTFIAGGDEAFAQDALSAVRPAYHANRNCASSSTNI